MQQMLEQLNRDHRQIEKQLLALDQLHTQSGPTSPDMLQEMLSQLHGLQHDHVKDHHDLEDQALDLLKSRYRISDLLISVIERDHTRLDSATGKAIAVVKQTLNNPAMLSAQAVKQQLSEFTEAYRNHIRTEEEVIFPMIKQLIAEEAIESTGSWIAAHAQSTTRSVCSADVRGIGVEPTRYSTLPV